MGWRAAAWCQRDFNKERLLHGRLGGPRPRHGAKIWLLITLEAWLRSACGDRNAASSGIGKQGRSSSQACSPAAAAYVARQLLVEHLQRC